MTDFFEDNYTEPEGRICASEGCSTPLPEGASHFRRYCDEHQPPKRNPPAKGKKAAPRRDSAPRVVVELGATKPNRKAEQKAKVEQGAAKYLKVIELGVAISGDATCASSIKAGSPALASALAELAEYQPALAKFFLPSENAGQAAAWVAVAVAAGGIALPVMAHHGLLPESIAAKLGGVFVAAHQPGDAPAA